MQNIGDIGARIASFRRERGMTQDELAAQLCITPQAVSKWERGTGLPDVTVFPALAEALGVTVGELFGEGKNASESAQDLPERFEELPLVARHEALGCYSDKKVKSCDALGVDFEDGSRVEYATRTVTNCGAGEIRLVEDEREMPRYNEKYTEYSETFANFHSLDISNSYSCDMRIVPSSDGRSRVYAKGSPRFISLIETSVSDDTLHLNVKSPTMGGERNADNSMTIEVAFTCGTQLKATVNGSGALETAIPFEAGSLTVNGSGDISVGDFGTLTLGINGSGDTKVGNVTGRTQLTVNGSGDIVGGRLGCPLHVSVNGSGDIRAESGRDVAVRIAGAGDVTLDRVEQKLTVAVTGAGDVRCGGEVETLSVAITGSGELDARGVTATDADIRLEGTSSAHIGHIVGRSTERVAKSAELRVDRRG